MHIPVLDEQHLVRQHGCSRSNLPLLQKSGIAFGFHGELDLWRDRQFDGLATGFALQHKAKGSPLLFNFLQCALQWFVFRFLRLCILLLRLVLIVELGVGF